MSTITTKDGVEIFYKDWGEGQPIVFSHGWPLSADEWDTCIRDRKLPVKMLPNGKIRKDTVDRTQRIRN